MLSDTSLFIASKISQRLVENNIMLGARTGSPIALLLSSQAFVDQGAAAPAEFIGVAKVDAATFGAINGADSIHDEKMEWARDIITKGVTRDLDVAKNTIQPVIDQVLEDVEKDLTEICSNKAHGYEIVQDNVPELFMDQKIENLFERYKNIPIRPLRTMQTFPELTQTELLERLKTGDDEVNKLLDDAVAAGYIDNLVPLYKWYFLPQGVSEINFSDQSISDPIVPVILYFLSIGLEANMPAGVNASIGVVTNYLKNLRGLLGAAVYRNIRMIERKIEDKELIQSVVGPSGERKIYVSKAVYNKFLDEGGSPEAILGTVVGSGSFSYASILDTVPKLEKTWAAHLESLTSTNDLNKLGLVILSIRKSVSNYIGEMEVMPLDAGTKADMYKRLSNATRAFYLTDLDVLNQSVRRLVFEVIFPAQKNARFIIEMMDKQNCEEGGQKRLAAAVTTSLIAEWLVKNLDVMKSK